MIKIRARKPAGGALFVWTLLLSSGIDLHLVWCHKPDGRVAIEMENLAGECRCEKCIQECGRRNRGACIHEPGALEIKSLLCRHETLPSRKTFAPPCESRPAGAPSFIAVPPAVPGPDLVIPAPAPFSRPDLRLHKPPPKSLPHLRC